MSSIIFLFDFQLHEGEDSPNESDQPPSSPEVSEEEEVEQPVVQTGTKPKKKSKKKKQQIDDAVESENDEFLVGHTSAVESTLPKKIPQKNAFSLEQKHLNPDNELKRIFGSRVVASTQKKKARGRAYVKSTWLINAKDNWSQIRKTGSSLILLRLLLFPF